MGDGIILLSFVFSALLLLLIFGVILKMVRRNRRDYHSRALCEKVNRISSYTTWTDISAENEKSQHTHISRFLPSKV